MFEGYAADLLATSLGRFVDVQKDKLRISLWSGECSLGSSCGLLWYSEDEARVHESEVGCMTAGWRGCNTVRERPC
jgi:hypothetical protein